MKGIIVRPGDKLVLCVNHPMREEEYDRLRESLRPLFDDSVEIAVIENVTGLAVYRPNKEVEA
ncbi:hypothetical protein ACWDHW_13180 [Streptomyces melanosporofaciens]